jgi:hypothetical protein
VCPLLLRNRCVNGDSTTAVAREQICEHVVFLATEEHAIMEATFSVLSVLGAI